MKKRKMKDKCYLNVEFGDKDMELNMHATKEHILYMILELMEQFDVPEIDGIIKAIEKVKAEKAKDVKEV